VVGGNNTSPDGIAPSSVLAGGNNPSPSSTELPPLPCVASTVSVIEVIIPIKQSEMIRWMVRTMFSMDGCGLRVRVCAYVIVPWPTRNPSQPNSGPIERSDVAIEAFARAP